MNTNPSTSLARAAQRAVSSPFFLASTLQEYKQTTQLNDEALASYLNCQVDDLVRLALCRRPDGEQQAFLSDITHLAQRFHLRADRLASIIRHVDALASLRHQVMSNQPTSYEGLLAAARDREDDPEEPTENQDD